VERGKLIPIGTYFKYLVLGNNTCVKYLKEVLRRGIKPIKFIEVRWMGNNALVKV
jgi:hypothetical protein